METTHAQQTTAATESQSDWVKTPVANLLRYRPSGTYFARVRIRGKLFRQALDMAGAWCSRYCGDLVRFLAFGGFRKTEAANITWADGDFDSGQIRVRVTKNGKPRSVPMIDDNPEPPSPAPVPEAEIA